MPSLAQSLELLQLKEPETRQECIQQLRQLDIKNKFGQHWFYAIAKSFSPGSFDLAIEKMATLLRYNCYYNYECRNYILSNISYACPPLPNNLSYQEKIERQERFRRKAKLDITNIVIKDYYSRKNIIFGLHQRALTGKPLQNMKVRLNQCYERALAK